MFKSEVQEIKVKAKMKENDRWQRLQNKDNYKIKTEVFRKKDK